MKKLLFNKYIEIFIYSRTRSERLKNKYKLLIGKYTLIEIQLLRLLKFFDPRMIKVCVPTRDKYKYEKIITKYNVSILTGPEDDLVLRTLLNIKKQKAIVRVTADDPLTSPELIVKFINLYNKNKYDYIYTQDYADGLIPELFSVRYLKKIDTLINNKRYSSHLTYFFIRNIKNFSKYKYNSINKDTSDITLSIDYKKDYNILKKVFKEFKYDYLIPTKDILNYIRKNKSKLKKYNKKNFFWTMTNKYDVSLIGETRKKIFY